MMGNMTYLVVPGEKGNYSTHETVYRNYLSAAFLESEEERVLEVNR